MRKNLFIASLLCLFCSCHESLEERAEREAREFTEKHCPTPVVNFTRTDSVHFDRTTRTYTYFETFFDDIDDSTVVAAIHDELHEKLTTALRNNPKAKTEREAGFSFAYVARSASHPDVILFNDTIRIK
ncbi:MAG: hypothetical protein IJR71_07430 [Prevotella sp.]|nr:hypothetical protein [Prevotella sp.]